MKRVQLRIVETERVHPHEIADPARERRIEKRLRVDGILRDPLMVGAVPDVDGYVLLDGTNRKRALNALGLPRVMVQVIDYADQHAVRLGTWCHSASYELSQMLAGIEKISGLTVSSLPPLAASDALASPATLAVILDKRRRYALNRSLEGSGSRADQLRVLVDLYEERMVRVDCDQEDVEEHSQRTPINGSSTLVAFPAFSRSQVVAMAMSGTLIPAGITRHLILAGRAMRVNLPLECLAGSDDQETANSKLQEHLSVMQPRLYTEPTILFDS